MMKRYPKETFPLWIRGGQWKTDGLALGRAPMHLLGRAPQALEQTDPTGVATAAAFVPAREYEMRFTMRLLEGQEAKFILGQALLDPVTRLDFFGAHRAGALRLSVNDEPPNPHREFEETGLDFLKDCAVRIRVDEKTLSLGLKQGTRCFEKTWRAAKGVFGGFVGLGTYRGRARFSQLDLKPGKVRPQAVFKIWVASDLAALPPAAIGRALKKRPLLRCFGAQCPLVEPVFFDMQGGANALVGKDIAACILATEPTLNVRTAIACGIALQSQKPSALVSPQGKNSGAAKLGTMLTQAVVRLLT